MKRDAKFFTIIAGPNGAGKTTFVQNIYPNDFSTEKFINADHFAQELNPNDVEKVAIEAGKRFLSELHRLLRIGNDIIVETTLSGNGLLKKLKEAQKNGFRTRLIFLWVSSSELCDFRVKGRVASGGHNIPMQAISRRYKRGLSNFTKYLGMVDECDVFLADETPVLVFSKDVKGNIHVVHKNLYQSFKDSLKKLSMDERGI